MLSAKPTSLYTTVHRATAANTGVASSPAFTVCRAGEAVDGEQQYLYPALHTLFLQRWRLSLVVQATTLNQQLLEEEREQLLSDVQERMTLSGQLEPTLAENDNAAGRLWDMSTGQLKRGDYQLIVKYGEFLAAQPELMQLAEQLGRSREAKSVPKKTRRWKPFVHWYANPQRCRSRLTVFSKAMIFCACCRQSWRRSASPSWNMNSTAG